jgi:hypothetical protein
MNKLSNLPIYVGIIFGLTTLLTALFFYKASRNSTISAIVIFAWLILQMSIGLSGFYTETKGFPPKFILLVFPPLLLIIALFVSPKGRKYLDGLDMATLTLLHTVRVLVELVLYWLFIYKAIPQLMTFEGRNFDILAGLSAPLIWYFGFVKNNLSKNFLLLWNIIGLGLLINIVVNAVLSAPFSFQQFAFDQPNIAVLYFPFLWLPCFVVPVVLLSHLAAIRKLIFMNKAGRHSRKAG